jgi:Spy/CpxP family protein refolding chaperone
MKLRTLAIAAAGLTLAVGAAGAASADTPWQAHHPRREEVNHRLDNINRHIRYERREGDLTAAQARRLHERDYMLRMQERRFAFYHNGHITRREQVRLNHEETRLHRHIPS